MTQETNQQTAVALQDKERIVGIALSGLMIALLAVSAQIVVPLGPIPFTLQTAVLCIVALVLPRRLAVLTVALYLVLGLLGLPVFSAARSGFTAFAGPTGGFLYGFLLAMIVAVLVRKVLVNKQALLADIVALACIVVVPYLFGTVHLMLVAHLDLMSALAAAVAPFVALDVAKAVLAFVIAVVLRKALASTGLAQLTSYAAK